MKEKIYYRGDRALKQKAKAQAAREWKGLGDWIDEAIKEKLERQFKQGTNQQMHRLKSSGKRIERSEP